jgi:ATP-dependent Lhr-like helicase
VRAHRTTLVFVNTRRLAERAARHLAERLGEDAVTAHHGSLAREHRLDAEQRLKGGELRALVATASLELGIDIGEVDLVCQLGSRARSPRSAARRPLRTPVGGLPKGRLFPLTRDDLVECAALLDGGADRSSSTASTIPPRRSTCSRSRSSPRWPPIEWDEARCTRWCARAVPYHDLTRRSFDAVVRMLADGFSTRRGRRGAYLHRDAVNGTSARTPRRAPHRDHQRRRDPRTADYDVDPASPRAVVGTLNEDFAIESLAGDIFQLGNTSYRILRSSRARCASRTPRAQPPTIPFWFGEAPAAPTSCRSGVAPARARRRTHLDREESIPRAPRHAG